MEAAMLIATFIGGGLALWLTWLWTKTHENLIEIGKQQREIQRKIEVLDRSLTEGLHEMEKKIKS